MCIRDREYLIHSLRVPVTGGVNHRKRKKDVYKRQIPMSPTPQAQLPVSWARYLRNKKTKFSPLHSECGGFSLAVVENEQTHLCANSGGALQAI